jgi:hypothetical protein
VNLSPHNPQQIMMVIAFVRGVLKTQKNMAVKRGFAKK